MSREGLGVKSEASRDRSPELNPTAALYQLGDLSREFSLCASVPHLIGLSRGLNELIHTKMLRKY